MDSFFSRWLIVELQNLKGAERPGADAPCPIQIFVSGCDFQGERYEMSRSNNGALLSRRPPLVIVEDIPQNVSPPA